MENNPLYLHCFNLIPNFGPNRLFKLCEYFESFKKAFVANKQELTICGIESEIIENFFNLKNSENSSAAGHNGVQSIIDNLGTQNFYRLRVGIETRATREELPTDAFVLQNFNDNELVKLQAEIFPQIKTEITRFIEN